MSGSIRIVKLTKLKGGFYQAETSEGSTHRLHEDSLVKYRLIPSLDIDYSILLEAIEHTEFSKAKAYCYNILSKKQYSVAQIRYKLTSKKYIFAEKVIDELLDIKLLDDDKLAKDIVYFSLKKGMSRLAIKNKLQNTMLPKDVIVNSLADVEESIEDAMEIASKKLRTLTKYEPFVRKQKLYKFLMGKGFSYETISKVMISLNFE